MKRTNNKFTGVKVEKNILLIMCILLFSLPVFADYEISWGTIDAGGGRSAGGGFVLVGTIGQPDTGQSSGGDFVLSSGFWPGSSGCIVNLTDLSMLAEQWLGTGEGFTADLDGNDRVDFADFATFSYWWYDVCPADWPLK